MTINEEYLKARKGSNKGVKRLRRDFVYTVFVLNLTAKKAICYTHKLLYYNNDNHEMVLIKRFPPKSVSAIKTKYNEKQFCIKQNITNKSTNYNDKKIQINLQIAMHKIMQCTSM